jgi:hypothetical protein
MGLLSTRFANIKQPIRDLMVKIIVRDGSTLDDMFGVTLIENQPLSKRLALLKKLDRFDNFYTENIQDSIQLVKPKIPIRNYLIHGI